ncbi:sensor histidine kinase [Brumimicrobium aurantiacum]|uniref:histidine kinase n=1 Tax=Brumimicrobium aurantiacum TaxID=1737063 RepID=A0A3E1EYF9_9FLAO|nr:histidine kinase dimerization/phosphoacceptor domain -containing protein [Brumimicrobium aurantiacum]RFC54567.1 PAS domain S-box protein [Brumimicrobium aurantiacum]
MQQELKEINVEILKTEQRLKELKNKALSLHYAMEENGLKPDCDQLIYSNEETDVTVQEKSKVVRKTEKFFNTGRWRYLLRDKELFWSDESKRIFELPKDYNGSILDFYLSSIDNKTSERLPSIRDIFEIIKESGEMNQTIITPNGIKKHLSFSSTPIFAEESPETLIGMEGFVRDLTDKIQGQKGLDNFFKMSRDLHCIVHKNKYFVRVSPSWIDLLGYTEEELLSRSYLNFIHEDDLPKSIEAIENYHERPSNIEQFENRYISKSGDIIYLKWNTKLDEETGLIYCNATNITKTKLENQKLLVNLSEKKLLLREIHHRVKNNLQIISSLLSLQTGGEINRSSFEELYESSKNRIRSMAAIHEMFYQSEQLNKIEFGKYIHKLFCDLVRSFSHKRKNIDYSINVNPVFVDLDTAIPLGLIINEIVTNSIKYGENRNGEVHIFVELLEAEDKHLKFIIGDRGDKVISDILAREKDSLGVMIIKSLVEQINGEIIQLKNKQGAIFELTIGF